MRTAFRTWPPFNATVFAEILHEVGVPAGVFDLVNGDGICSVGADRAGPEAESAETLSGTARQAAGAGVGAIAGALIGNKMGIAAFGTAVSARWPFAIVGGVVGWLGSRRQRSRCRTMRAG